MKFSVPLALASVVAASPTVKVPSYDQAAIDSGRALTSLGSLALQKSASYYSGSCNAKNVQVRREWRTLPKGQRKAYIKAVKCLQSTPSVLAPGVANGSKSLFDDFVYVHLKSTPFIHYTGNFLVWHRFYIHTYQEKLKACGYNDPIPYWEWGFDVNDPHNSPVFDGSDTSLGSDGDFVPGHPGVNITIPGFGPLVQLAPGTGGGCVNGGPFAGMVTHLGPITQPDPTQDNPRCLKRDLCADSGRRFTTFRNSTDLILQSPTIEFFRTTMEGDPSYVPHSLGVHGGGHFIIGGDPGSDAFISPGDPAFYLHHGQIDRLYWIWQNLDFPNRQGVFGTNTMLNNPPSANTTVDDFVDLSPLAGQIQIKDLLNTLGGPFCYVYA